MPAQAGTFTHKLGGKDYVFSLLSVEDLMTLTATLPNPNGEVVATGDLNRWSQSPVGCEHFLLLSAQKQQPMYKFADVRSWGSIRQRIAAAADILGRSVINGEEDPPTQKARGRLPPRLVARGCVHCSLVPRRWQSYKVAIVSMEFVSFKDRGFAGISLR